MEDFYRAHARAVHAFLHGLCRNRDTAEDLMQETFVRATRAMGGYRGGSPRAWLFAIARTTFLDATRRDTPEPVEEPPVTSSRDPDVAEAETVRRALARLPEAQRAALVLGDQLEVPYAEIGQVLGRSEGAVKVLIHRARASFRRAYEEEGGHA
ncbi:RNA polymerase sigma factor [Egibacter rhizosphaerae]|uniref:RNA polymerase sigma factor n=1 Tax=Egibacter rhizosphaerae TaxID=1670831 RepID=A0A411YIV4_9ACTN|nr:RNA polymerase sigma factor [Egibacter rhizosphaerae]QBI21081.1 RNA polymerase sigma factor [Egibacter rhizosphaerae]